MAKKNKCILHVACLLGKQLLLSVAQGQILLALLVNDFVCEWFDWTLAHWASNYCFKSCTVLAQQENLPILD